MRSSPGQTAGDLPDYAKRLVCLRNVGVAGLVVSKARKRSSSKRQRIDDEKAALSDLTQPKDTGLQSARRQLKSAAKVAVIAAIVVWLLALGFYSGLDSIIPIYIAASLTLAGIIAALLVRRNLKKSEDMGSILSGAGDLSETEREARIEKLEGKVAKGDAPAILAKAQLQMQSEPKEALKTLENVDLKKAQKLVAAQVRAMRGMIHLNLGEVKKARELAEEIDLAKAPDPKLRANLSAVVAESWARSGNAIEATELLDKYDANDEDFSDVRMQLLRARAFTCAHRQDIKGMKKALKQLLEISPQLAGMFVGQKRIHPLLQKEARRQLEKSGFAPKQRIQTARR